MMVFEHVNSLTFRMTATSSKLDLLDAVDISFPFSFEIPPFLVNTCSHLHF
jgi:hypothetical protein